MSNQHPQQPETGDKPAKTTPAPVTKPEDVPTVEKPAIPPVPPNGWLGMERGKEYRLPSGNTIINS